MEILSQLPKNVYIFLLFFPFLIFITILGYLVKKGFDKLERKSWYWLLATIILIVLYINGIIHDSLPPRVKYFGILSIITSFEIYESMKKR